MNIMPCESPNLFLPFTIACTDIFPHSPTPIDDAGQGVPLVYELDDNLKVIPHKDAIAPLQGRYLGDLEAVKARIAGVANQTK